MTTSSRLVIEVMDSNRSKEAAMFFLLRPGAFVCIDGCSERIGLSTGKAMGEPTRGSLCWGSIFLAVAARGAVAWPSFRKRTPERTLGTGVLGVVVFSPSIAETAQLVECEKGRERIERP